MPYIPAPYVHEVQMYQQADQLDIRIPVVDMRDFYNPESRQAFIDTLYEAMTTIGFFAVRNTGVNRQTVDEAYQQAVTFFKSPEGFKAQSYVPQLRGQRGFVPGETAKGHSAKDFKQFYHIGRELPPEELDRLGIRPNVWPNQAGFKEGTLSLYNELNRYVEFLHEAIVAVINQHAQTALPPDFFKEMMLSGDTLLRALYYPALTHEQMRDLNQPLYWAAEHTDIDLLAILPFATEKGLQVEMNGQWLNVVVPEDAFVVNVGDMLKNMTNGLFVSAKHRVMALEPSKERFSMVLFVHPVDDTPLDPLPSCIEQTGGIQLYAPGTRQEFLWERLLELNIAPGLLGPYSQTGHTERQIKYHRESPQVVKMLIENGLASQEVLDSVKK